MGSTEEIADVIAEELRGAGVSVDVHPADRAPDPAGYRAVVVGSAIYLRRWRRAALRYLRRHRAAPRGRPVWLFQSGPCGGADGSRVPFAARRLAGRIGAGMPVTFGGRLDRAHAVGPVARWVASSAELRGDNRDWDSIRACAHEIAATLTGVSRIAPRDRSTGERGSGALEPSRRECCFSSC
ncbi:flavodoxin domain-containing protein [Pseudonocardia acaciae]|uniref:flavodoxin domain-containing protein n=1 Tax=Pseudonocardia acaciae TaxID=551276 RepID=UPI000683E705|nr:flavodoxin domain-containing protein [Pseudonocardia acaciae]